MYYSDDAYAAMLLTMSLSPDREEYARPYTTKEFRALETKVRASKFGSLGGLLNADVSGLMIYLKIDEPQAVRLYSLLNRMIQLMYELDGFEARNIHAVTCFDEDYPRRVMNKLGPGAPVFFFRCGDGALLNRPAIAILGVQGVRTSGEARRAVESLAAGAAGQGYAVITSGEPGISTVAAVEAARCGARLVEVPGGELGARVAQADVGARIQRSDMAVLSLNHPDAPFTFRYAADRSRLMFALSDAAFVFNTDGRRGEIELLQGKVCDWVYAWSPRQENQPLIARGAIPFDEVSDWDFQALARRWSTSDSEQLSIFDMF